MMAFRYRASHGAIASFIALRALLIWGDPQPACASEDFTRASPGMLNLLKEQHHASHGLFVTTPAGRSDPSVLSTGVPVASVAVDSDLSAKQLRLFKRHHRPDKPLRIRGTFGEFSGRVTSFDEAGLTGLRPDGRYGPRVTPPPEPLSWSQVERVDRRGSSAGVYGAW